MPTEVSFVDLPLHDAMAFFADYHKANFVLDRAALNDVGIAEDTLVNLELSGVSLRTALKLLLDPLNLVCVVQDEVLLVTTREKVETTYLTRVYPVSDLAESAEELEVLARTVEEGTNSRWAEIIRTEIPPQQAVHGGSISVVPRVRSLVVKQSQLVHDEIVELLTQLRQAQALLPE
ncbi:MAG: hypothetical protein B7Z47_07870 [Chthoniobacter sp. 12-60-6]|nr:MAG: hypothetical protein B7Z47_07870 [Chthoniobacter sp. 12-60-6]